MTAERKKMMWAGGLMVVAVGWLYSSFNPSTPTAPPPTTKRQAAMSTLDSDAGSKPSAAKRPKGFTADGADPTLQIDRLVKLQATNYEGSNRNIFQFYTPPPPPIPAPVKPVMVAGGPNNGGPVVPPPPPPPPPIPLKYYGLASAVGVSPKRAFLQHDDDIFIAREGDIVQKRYKVLKINDTNIEMEDTQNNSKQKLPLQES
jgi:hypothetical protein